MDLELQSQHAPAQGTLNESGLSKAVLQGQGCLELCCAPVPGVISVGHPTECLGGCSLNVPVD